MEMLQQYAHLSTDHLSQWVQPMIGTDEPTLGRTLAAT